MSMKTQEKFEKLDDLALNIQDFIIGSKNPMNPELNEILAQIYVRTDLLRNYISRFSEEAK